MASNTILSSRTITISVSPVFAQAIVYDAIIARNGKVINGDGHLSAKFGSQAALRLIGGWLIPTRWFPVKAHADFEETAHGTKVTLRVADSMGVGIKSGMKGKYGQAVEELSDHFVAHAARARQQEMSTEG